MLPILPEHNNTLFQSLLEKGITNVIERKL